jgi:hypothetical protein
MGGEAPKPGAPSSTISPREGCGGRNSSSSMDGLEREAVLALGRRQPRRRRITVQVDEASHIIDFVRV